MTGAAIVLLKSTTVSLTYVYDFVNAFWSQEMDI